jgi:hypothetical protein
MSTAHVGITSICKVPACVFLFERVIYIPRYLMSVCLCEMLDRPAFNHKSGHSLQRQGIAVPVNPLAPKFSFKF